MPVAVIGIGQSLRGDDAVGLEAVRLWEATHPGTARRLDVRVALLEGPGLDLLELIEGVESAVLVDAVCSQAPAGSLHRAKPEDLLERTHNAVAAHGWNVGEVLRLANALAHGAAPKTIRLVGVEAGQMDLGQGLSGPVRLALAAVATAIEDEVVSLLGA